MDFRNVRIVRYISKLKVARRSQPATDAQQIFVLTPISMATWRLPWSWFPSEKISFKYHFTSSRREFLYDFLFTAKSAGVKAPHNCGSVEKIVG